MEDFMAMEGFRKKSNRVIIGFVFVVIVITFVFWGVGEFDSNTQGSFTSVNGEQIAYEDFQWLYRAQASSYEQLMGSSGMKLNENMMKMIERNVASSLVAQTALGQRSADIGFRISDEEILDLLKETKAFHDPEKNRFSPGIYARVLEANGLKQTQYERSLKRDLMGARVRDLVEMSILVSDAELADAQKLDQTEFTLNVAQITSDSLLKSGAIKISDQTLKDYYEKHKGEFLSAAKRKATIARLSPLRIEKAITTSQAEIDDFYSKNVKDSKEPQWNSIQAHAYHLLISDTSDAGFKRAKELESKIRRAKDLPSEFRKVASESSEDYSNASKGGDLGYFNDKAMVKPFSNAVFTGKVGSMVGPIKTDFGYHLIYVADRTTTSNELANRKTQIAYEIRKAQLDEKLAALQKDVSQTLKAKGKTEELLTAQGFEVLPTKELEAQQRDPEVPFLLTQEIFRAPLKTWAEPLLIQGTIFVYNISEEVAPQPLDFAKARAQVLKKVEVDQAETFIKTQAEALKGKKLAWADLRKFGATLKVHKGFKPYSALEVPELGGNEPALKAAQSLTESSSVAGPLVHDGNWTILMGESFKQNSQTALNAEEKMKAKQNLRDERKALVIDRYMQGLLKTARIPEDFRKKYGI